MRIVKSSGQSVPFDLVKIRESVVRAGGKPEHAIEIANAVAEKVREGMGTKELYGIVQNEIAKRDVCVACRYSLRDALVKLGPAGFVFEHYIARLLAAHGYDTELPDEYQGGCVRHEIDVVARKDGKTHIIEAKFRNDPNDHVRLQDALVLYARFLDLADGATRGTCPLIDDAWLVTNGVFSERARTYGSCKGLRLIAWNYPARGSLASLIDAKGLYPITVLADITNAEAQSFAGANIMLCKELAALDAHDVARRTGLSQGRVMDLLRLAEKI